MAYSASLYGYCDARKIAAVWGQSISQAKITLGNKVLANLQHLADADIASTANRVPCSWEDSQFSYNDAVRLGQYWGRQPHEAKAKVAAMLTQMGHKQFMIAMGGVLR